MCLKSKLHYIYIYIYIFIGYSYVEVYSKISDNSLKIALLQIYGTHTNNDDIG